MTQYTDMNITKEVKNPYPLSSHFSWYGTVHVTVSHFHLPFWRKQVGKNRHKLSNADRN